MIDFRINDPNSHDGLSFLFVKPDFLKIYHQWSHPLPLKRMADLSKVLYKEDLLKEKIEFVKIQKEFLLPLKNIRTLLTTQLASELTSQTNVAFIDKLIEKIESGLVQPMVPHQQTYKDIQHVLHCIECCVIDHRTWQRYIYGNALLLSIWYFLSYPKAPLLLPVHFDVHPNVTLPTHHVGVDTELEYLFTYTHTVTEEVVATLSRTRVPVDFEQASTIYNKSMSKIPNRIFKPLSQEALKAIETPFKNLMEQIIKDCKNNPQQSWLAQYSDHYPNYE